MAMPSGTAVELNVLLQAPRVPGAVPTFSLIRDCEVVRDDEDGDMSESGSGSESEVEEVFPCECRYEANCANGETQACGWMANCINRELFMECDPQDCPCRDNCQNRRFQTRHYANVKVVETPGKGFGLFTCEELRPGTLVMEYVGEIVTREQMARRAETYAAQGQRHFYFMTLRPNQIIDATCRGNLSRFMNHSCAPNCETQKWIVGGRMRIGLFTTRTVKAATELTFDYKFVRFGNEAQKCLCGEANCAGFIGVSSKDAEGRRKGRGGRSQKSRPVGDVASDQSTEGEEEELESFLAAVQTGVASPDDMALLATHLVRTEDPATRRQLLDALRNTTAPLCLRKFLTLHGLRILGVVLGEHQRDPGIVTVVLDILERLPVTTRNAVEDANWPLKLSKLALYPELVEGDASIPEKADRIVAKWKSLERVFRIPKVGDASQTTGEEQTFREEEVAECAVESEAGKPPSDFLMAVPEQFASALQKKRQGKQSSHDLHDLRDSHETNREHRDGQSRGDDRHRNRATGSRRDDDHFYRPSPARRQILDPQWRMAQAPDGQSYYYHVETRETRWDAPMIDAPDDHRHGEWEAGSREKEQRGREDRDRDRDLLERHGGHGHRSQMEQHSRAHAHQSLRSENEPVLEGINDLSQLQAIIERAKARRTAPVEEVTDGQERNGRDGRDGRIDMDEQPIRKSQSRRLSSPSQGQSSKMRDDVSAVVVRFLSHYKAALGADFKNIARKHTHRILEKEQQGETAGDKDFEMTSRTKNKIKAYLASALKGRGVKLIPEHEALL